MTLVDAGQEEGVLEQGERKMIVSIFRLGDTLAREIMVPRIDLQALDANTPLPQAVDALLDSGYSRVPVYQDTVDNILGLLYSKDLLRIWREGNQLGSLIDLLRPAYFVPEAKKVDELLAEMQNQRIHLAIVVDEYGGVAGLVTLEDIVEEIVGEIHDEYDKAEEMLFQMVNESEYVFLGRIDLDDFNEIMESALPNDEADTLAGFIYSRIGRVPVGGENVQVDDLQLTVEHVSGRRIRKVRAQRITPASQDGERETHVDE
jgi:CBS domain containing-hemolysin-like protein